MRGNRGIPTVGVPPSAPHPRRPAQGAHQTASPGAAANVAGNSKDKAMRREREMAALRQRIEFDWRV